MSFIRGSDVRLLLQNSGNEDHHRQRQLTVCSSEFGGMIVRCCQVRNVADEHFDAEWKNSQFHTQPTHRIDVLSFEHPMRRLEHETTGSITQELLYIAGKKLLTNSN